MPGVVRIFRDEIQNVGMPSTRAAKKNEIAGPEPADTINPGRSLRRMRHAWTRPRRNPRGRLTETSRIQWTRWPASTDAVPAALTTAHTASWRDHHGLSASRSSRTPPLLDTRRMRFGPADTWSSPRNHLLNREARLPVSFHSQNSTQP